MAEQVRAKFYVEEIAKTIHGGRVKLRVVSMTIRNELAIEFYDVGEEYFVDFTRAPKGEEGMGD